MVHSNESERRKSGHLGLDPADCYFMKKIKSIVYNTIFGPSTNNKPINIIDLLNSNSTYLDKIWSLSNREILLMMVCS